jgi:hypothetical protein
MTTYTETYRTTHHHPVPILHAPDSLILTEQHLDDYIMKMHATMMTVVNSPTAQ